MRATRLPKLLLKPLRTDSNSIASVDMTIGKLVGQTADAFQFLDTDGTTVLFGVDASGVVTSAGGVTNPAANSVALSTFVRGTNGQLPIGQTGAATAYKTVSGAITIDQDGVTALSATQTVTGGIQAAGVARTATADGTTTGTIAAGTSFVVVTCDDANKIIKLPAPVVGNVIRLMNGATGYELRSSTTATIAINGGTDTAAESAIPANTLVTCVCTSATTWVGMNQSTAGTVTATEVAAN